MEVVIPAIADGIQEAEILALLVRVGQHVLAEQPVLELEAGKASFELPSPATGQIEEILVGIGDDVRVGDVVLTLRTVEDEVPERPPITAAAAAASSTETPSTSESLMRETYVRASPAARRRARELGIDIDALAAELDGRVTIEQIEACAGRLADPSDVEDAERGDLAALAQHGVPLGDWRSVPHGVLQEVVDVTSLEAARQRYRDEHEAGPRLTLTVFVLKACAIALREHPRMNSSLIRQGRALAIKRYIHIAVGGEARQDLCAPVIEHADRRPLCELSGDLDALDRCGRARTNADQHGEAPTFSITTLRGLAARGAIRHAASLGLFAQGGVAESSQYPDSASFRLLALDENPGASRRAGLHHGLLATRFTPLIHPSQVGALGICRAYGEAGRMLLPLCLAYDRRVNDDAAASSFLATIAELLRDPIAMLMRS